MTKVILAALLFSVATMPARAQDEARDKLASLVDGRMEQVVHALNSLAADPKVQSADWDAVKPVLADAQAAGPKGTYWFAWPDGNYCTVDKGLVGQSLSDRPYFSVVMGGKKVIGELVVSKSTGRKAIVLTVPVFAQGLVVGAVGASLFAEEFSAALAEDLELPEGSAFFAINAENTAAVHTDPARLFEGLSVDGIETVTSPLTGWRIGIQR